MGTLPIPVVDAWGTAAIVPLAWLLGIVALAAGAYGAAIRVAARLPLRVVLPAIGAALTIALVAPAIFSSDLYAYLAYGERAAHGCNPWGSTATCNAGPLAELARIAWHHDPPRLVYGPAFVIVAALVAPLGAIDPRAAVLAWRIAMCLAFLGAIARIAQASGMRAAIIVGANPVALWTVGEGHNDALMLLFAAFAFGVTNRARSLFWIAAIAVKGIALVPALWIERKWGARVVVLAATVACYLPLLLAVDSSGGVRASTTTAYDIASLLPLPHLIAQAGVAILLGGFLLVRAPRDERIARYVLLAWCLLPNAYPWYALWILPFAAYFWGTSTASALVWAATVSIVRYIPDATIGNDPALRSNIVFMQFLPPLAIIAAARLQKKSAVVASLVAIAATLMGCAKPEPGAQNTQATAPPAQSAQSTVVSTPSAQFGYVLTPPAEANAPAGSPRILEIALNAQTLISPGPVLVRITTTTDVVNVIAKALGREITIQQASPGIFSGGEDIPRVPAFMRRSYEVEIIAANAAGKTAKATVPVTLR